MTALNVSVEDFISVLSNMRNNGVKLINLDMIPDENHPSMNKLVLHAVRTTNDNPPEKGFETSDGTSPYSKRITIRNPNINPNTDDIFNAFNGIV